MAPIKISAIAFEDGRGGWIAQCIEHDIAARADTLLHLSKMLEREVLANLLLNRRLGRDGLAGIPPAPEPFRMAYETAKDKFFPRPRPGSKPAVEIGEFRVVEPLAA